MIDVQVSVYSHYPCGVESFTLNHKPAKIEDFGEIETEKGDSGYTCTGIRFDPKLPTTEVLTKYHITVDDYKNISSMLNSVIHRSFPCYYCV